MLPTDSKQKSIYFRLIFGLLLLILASACMANINYPQVNCSYSLNGIQNELFKNVDNRLNIVLQSYGKKISTEDCQNFYHSAQKNIKAALSPYGFFKPTVESRLNKNQGDWQAIFTITPGKQITIAQVNLHIVGPGTSTASLKKYIKTFPLKKGMALNTITYDKAKQRFFDIAENSGFLAAKITLHEIKVDTTTHLATITLHFDTGYQFHFGHIKINPNPYDANYLKRFLTFKAGDKYSTAALLKAQKNLNNSNNFAHVAVIPQRNNQQANLVPVEVSVTAKKPHHLNLGAGYGTDTGIRGSFAWDWRQITRSGDYFSATGQASVVQSNFAANYYIPGYNPVTDEYNIGAAYKHQSPNAGGRSDTLSTSVAYTSIIAKWRQTTSLSYQHEIFKLDHESTQISNLLMPSLTLGRTVAKNKIFTKNGNRFTLILRGSNRNFLSDTNFLQLQVKNKFIYSPNDWQRIILRGNLGYTTVHDLEKFPLSLRFFAGGAQSVRGYNYQTLGPGRYLLEGSTEIQQKIYRQWYTVGFFDIGNAMNHFSDGMKRGIGGGIMYASPIGPLELTVGYGIDKDSIRIQFSMGPDL